MKIPVSTYRVQINPDFGFKKTEKIINYLNDLGISTLYASPIFESITGSKHGYDIINSNKINPELGGKKKFMALVKRVKKNKMTWLQDIVPNHMAYSSQNGMIMDIFENGKNSPFRNFFDIEWGHTYNHLRGKIVAPFLGGHYADCLHNGELKLIYDKKGLAIDYYGNRFPLSLKSYAKVFSNNIVELKEKLGRNGQDYFIKFMGILNFLGSFNAMDSDDTFYHQIHPAKLMLWELYNLNTKIKRFMDKNIKIHNGEPQNPDSYDLLDDILTDQVYRLTFWKVATEELNYRRFFTVNNLISLRVEDYDVFKYTHSLELEYAKKEIFDGFRIDHIDGLFDPEKYTKLLRAKSPHTYIVVEKILEKDETLRENWPVQGTTGYDFLNHLNGIFCVKRNAGTFTRIYENFLGEKINYEQLVTENKRLIIGKHMAGDIDNLSLLIKKLSEKDRQGRDITLYALRRALVEVITFFPVYRTYINTENISEIDQAYLRKAINKAKKDMPTAYYEIKFIEKFMLFDLHETLSEKEKSQMVQFIMKLQQFTGPLIAKGFEDTVLYIYNRLVSLNEVGADPKRFGYFLDEFHNFNLDRANNFPITMNNTSSHDTKRGEDFRARINVLSEIPSEWNNKIKEWRKINQFIKHKTDKKDMPTPNDEYLLYQVLLGTFPFSYRNDSDYITRIKDYIIKAIREAKVNTAWIANNPEYEKSSISFVEKILKDTKENTFLKSFKTFFKKIAFYGAINSLSQVILKATSPGIPDFYQGTELWDLSLVDPDNRRAVDYKIRKRYLNEIIKNSEDKEKYIKKLLKTYKNGKIKMFATYHTLMLRNEMSDFFVQSDYIPLEAEGEFENNIIAFARKLEDNYIITIAPRFLTKVTKPGKFPLGKIWRNTKLKMPQGMSLHNIFTDEKINCRKKLKISTALKHLPIAVFKGKLNIP
ncbi:MAG: malto-oligosyltrehalose synthase [Candidatus Muiribacteriota bacterium]